MNNQSKGQQYQNKPLEPALANISNQALKPSANNNLDQKKDVSKKKLSSLDWVFRISFWLFLISNLPLIIVLVSSVSNTGGHDLTAEGLWYTYAITGPLFSYGFIFITIICAALLNKEQLTFLQRDQL